MKIMNLTNLKYEMILACVGMLSACQSTAPPQCTPQEIQKSKEIQYVNPEYPKAAKDRDWEGMVAVITQIDTKGKVTDALVHKSSGHEILDAAAVAAAKKSLFQPATCKGTPVPSRAIRKYVFRLEM